ncbi:MAG TPA: vitamin K epoxide reductase family protein [Xanthomonadaceae bacterium]|nr:vitamin K epoxide reductase family protein [Xanthomonadaceae bacterium]
MARSRHDKKRAPRTGNPMAPWKLEPDRVLLGLALFGLLITGYLVVVAFSAGSAAFCAEGSGCDLVQGSRWSTLLGAPIALWGFALYALIAVVAGLTPPRPKRWRRLWVLALLGVAVSLYLTVVGVVALQAVCAWCLASLATVLAMFVVLNLRRPESPGMAWSRWWLRNGALAVVVLAALQLYHSDLLAAREDPRLAALATHLDSIGARYYGASWCPNCQAQHRAFGAAHKRLPYVECSPEGRGGPVAFACVSQEIGAYPTWIIRGRRMEQMLEPETLARYSGFDWDGFRPD